MLRHTVLCLVLAFQCTTAIDFDRLGNRIENRHYNHTVDVAHRDDWFWDDHFWRYPHMMRMECPDGYGWEGDYKEGECKMCKPGQYSASWGPTVRCTDCPPRYYQPNAGSNKCMRCPDWSPMSASGSRSAQDCEKMKDKKMQATTSATIVAEIEVAGDYTWMNDVLNEMSGYHAHMMSAHWKYDEEKDCSMGTVSFSMAKRAAFEAHMYVQELKTMIPLVNDWISTGHAYVNRIFSMLNVADSFYLLGLNMDPTEIHRRMRNVKVMKVDSHYHENCEANQMPYAAMSKSCANMMFCEMDASYNEDESSQVYLSYTAESEACKTLGGVNRMRNYIRDWKMTGCGEAESCRKRMMWCEYNMEKKESWFVVYVSKKYARKLDEAFFEDYKMMKDDNNVDWKMNKFFTAENCPGGPKESTSTECPDKCGENQELCWQSGMCRGCPFGSFFDDDGQKCIHCDLGQIYNGILKRDYLISETYMPNSAGSQSCIPYHGDYTLVDDHELTQQYYRIDRRPFDIPRDNRQRYKMDLEGKLDVCYAIQIKEDFGKFCSDKFPDLKDLSFDDFSDFDLTKLSCLIKDRMTELYKSNCEDRDYKWPSTDDFYWVDAACMAVRHVTKTEMNMKEKNIKCEEVDESMRHITMPFTLQKGFSNDLDWGSILIPLLQPVSHFMRADFSTATRAVRAAMEHLGMYKTSELTGLKMTDYVRDLILNVPQNLKMTKGSWEMTNKMEDVFCENGNVRKDCRSACAMSYNQCIQRPGHDSFELTCTADECNNCAVSYKYKEGEEEKTYECVDICDSIMNPDNGFVALVMGNPDKDATSRIYRMACNKGYRVKATEDELKSCNEEKPKEYTCDAEGNPKESFECMEDKCEVMPDNLENGFVKAYRNHPGHSCRFVEMACDPGFEMKGEAMRFCDGEGNWMGEMPKCEPAKCKDEVKETVIENGMFINQLVGTSMSWYRCNVNNPTYKGENDYFAAEQCGENIVCGRHENDHCPPMIENGYKVREWKQMSHEKENREKEIWNAQYRCAPKYAIKDHEMFKDDDKKHGWSQCSDGEENKLPTCVRVDDGSDDERKPCKMPEVIYNGELVEEFKNDKGEVTHGKYRCNEGFMMVETIKQDHGFCRDWDRSYELPYCVKPEEWYKIEFELVNGYGKMENAGRVKARHHYADGRMGEWYSACDDHFNSPAAGSVCRTLGFNYGKMIEAPKRRMRPIKHVPFGITNFWCYYDDVLPQSHNCHSEDYGKMGYPLCMPEEQIAVSCFDVWWNVDVRFKMKSKNKHKMFCPVEIEKEGVKMKTKKMGLHVSWGGLKENKETGNYDYTEFVEGTHYESKKFRKRKGFRAIYIGDINQYDCFYCNVHLGDHWLNPSDPDSEEASRATNHNCGHKDN